MLTAEQKEARRKGIGGSDVASVFGMEPYGCKLKLYHDKTGVKPDFEDINGNMERGIYLEDIVVDIYRKKSGNEVVVTKEHFSDKVYPWMLANIDGKITIGDITDCVLEIKCPSRDTYYRMKKDGVPDTYILQGQHYMYVLGAEKMEYAIFCADSWEMEIVKVDRDDKLINRIITAEKEFWEQNVLAKIAPERLPYGDSRCKMCDWRLGCWKDEWNELDFEFIKHSDYETIESAEFDAVVADLTDNMKLLKRADLLVSKNKREIITIMGDKLKVQCAGGKVSHKWEKKTYHNTKKLFIDHPLLSVEYAYENASRSLRFYPKKEK